MGTSGFAESGPSVRDDDRLKPGRRRYGCGEDEGVAHADEDSRHTPRHDLDSRDSLHGIANGKCAPRSLCFSRPWHACHPNRLDKCYRAIAWCPSLEENVDGNTL